jgi:hypothetical protein
MNHSDKNIRIQVTTNYYFYKLNFNLKLTAMKNFIGFLLIIVTMVCQGQVKQNLRVEFSTEDKEDAFEVIPLGEQGLIAITLEDIANKKTKWEFRKLDIKLSEVKVATIDLSSREKLIDFMVEGDRVMMLFLDLMDKKFRFVELNTTSMEHEMVECSNVPRMALFGGLSLAGRTAYAVVHNRRNILMFIADFEQKKSKKIVCKVPDLKKITFAGIESSNDHKSVYLFLGCKIQQAEFNTQVQKWDDQGKMEDSYFLQKIKGYRYSMVKYSQVSEDEMIFCGTYSNSSVNTATGCFITGFKDGKSEYFTRFSFMDLKNFGQYANKDIGMKATGAVAKAVNMKVEATYYAITHPVLLVGDRLYMVTEFYYPTYYVTTNSKGEKTKHFDGNQYTHAAVICFDKKGEKLWENVFEMAPTHKPKKVVMMVAVSVNEAGEVRMMYSSRSKIFIKAFDNKGKTIEDKEKIGITASGADEKTRNTTSTLEHWYGNEFIVYGEQKVKSQGSKKRKVLYINKVSVD